MRVAKKAGSTASLARTRAQERLVSSWSFCLPAQSLDVFVPCKLSGVVIGGVGSAFRGVVAGSVALFVQQYGFRKNKS